MKSEATKTEKEADYRLAQTIFKELCKINDTDRKLAVALVRDLSLADSFTLREVVDRVRSERPSILDRTQRMVACAQRGIPQAWHLYGPLRKLSHFDIIGADEKALAAIADPDADIPVVAPNGETKAVPVTLAITKDFRQAWDAKSGVIEVKRQQRLLEAKQKASVASQKNTVPYTVESIRQQEDGTCTVNIKESTVPLILKKGDVKILREMLAGCDSQ